MTMWIIIMWTIIALLGAAFVYLGFRIPRFLSPSVVAEWSPLQSFLCGSLVSLFLIGLITFCIDFVNAIVCLLYLAFFWVISDFLFWIISKIASVSFQHYYAGFVAVSACIITLTIGWYLNHHVWQTRYDLTTPKNVPDFKIALFADSHLGTTFDAEGFIQHLKTIQEQKPDIIVIAGDYVDDDTSKDQMIKATQALGKIKTKYGIYFVFGNHDKGYYGAQHRGFSAQELVDTLTRNGIKVLRDEAVLSAPGFYVIGRRDFSEVKEQGATRKSIQELIQELDNTKYMIVLDHQPVEYEKDADAGVDLVLSGHTHGGQLFPFNQVGKWIGANDLVYGHEKRKKTDFIVTSGISDWAIQFKTGTKSEFVIINIKKGK